MPQARHMALGLRAFIYIRQAGAAPVFCILLDPFESIYIRAGSLARCPSAGCMVTSVHCPAPPMPQACLMSKFMGPDKLGKLLVGDHNDRVEPMWP